MKTINKLLMASAMVVTLGTTASCNKNNIVTGIPYTIVPFLYLDLPETEPEEGKSVTFKFNCTGGDDIKYYWATTEASSEASHTFTTEPESHIIVIAGNVKSISVCDENGTPLVEGNNYIESIVFSNTVVNIPSKAFLVNNLTHFFIPSSVTSIGDEAFFITDPRPMKYICEPTSRPGGWSKTWCTFSAVEPNITWGVGLYIDEDEYNSIYIISNSNQTYEAFYFGSLKCLLLEKSGIETLSINNFVNIGGRQYAITGIAGCDNVTCSTLKKVTIPKSVQYIMSHAFSNCDNLTDVEFAENSNLKYIDYYAFAYCHKLGNVVLPDGVLVLGDDCFYDTYAPTQSNDGETINKFNLTLPSSVRVIFDELVGNFNRNIEITMDITAFKTKESIPTCFYTPFDFSKKITFKHDASVGVNEFVNKNWPAAEEGKYIWEPATSLS